MRALHNDDNHHDGRPAIGMTSTYRKSAELLANGYVCYLVAGLLSEIAGLFEDADPKYVTNPGTQDLRARIADVEKTIPYFWFLFNAAPAYDRFNWSVHYATDEELKAWGSYRNAPSERIPFNQHIFSNFETGLSGWNNARVGIYDGIL